MASTPSTGAELKTELRGDAQTVTDSAKQRLYSEADARKGSAAEQAKSLSSALESAAGELQQSPAWLRSIFEQGAQKLQSFAQTIETKDSRALSRDVQQLARQHPGTFLAGCAAAGFAAARVLKAGVEDTASQSASGSYQPSQSAPQAAGMSRAPNNSEGFVGAIS